MMAVRGRPKGTMTRHRRQVLALLIEAKDAGERVTLAAISRRCGLHDRKSARRIVRDLMTMGAVPV